MRFPQINGDRSRCFSLLSNPRGIAPCEDLKTSLLFSFSLFPRFLPLSRSRFRAARRARSRTYLAESRGARRRHGGGCPSEVKVRRVGTGCARIHFFGLALDFFARGISSHVCAADLAYTLGSRDTLSLVCIGTFLAASRSFFFALVLVAHVRARVSRLRVRIRARVWYRWYSGPALVRDLSSASTMHPRAARGIDSG